LHTKKQQKHLEISDFLEKTKKSGILLMVMYMYQVKKTERLRANVNIGNKHIDAKFKFSSSYPLHWHNYFEIELILNGKAKSVYNGIEKDISRADLYLLTPVDFHSIECDEPVELINISFDESCISENKRLFLSVSENPKMKKLNDEEFLRFKTAAKLLEQECENCGNGSNILLQYLLMFFSGNEPYLSENKEHLTGIRKAIEFLELHFREKITLEQIALLSGYNTTYFSELFKRVTGETFIDRLKFLRVNYAKLLLSGGFSVTETCYASGFGSLSNFQAVFKEKCGVSPGEYKRINNN